MRKLSLSTLHQTPYGWPLRQLRIPQAHKVTRGSKEIVVAVIDLGYTYHPDHEGHLWVNPSPTRGDIHGWDCHDDDDTLKYNFAEPESRYNKGHHTFIVGEVVACAPQCPVMIVRVGYGNPESWWRGIDYAVAHGAKIVIIPHGFSTHGKNSKSPLFYRGTDFSYPLDNPEIRRALDDAYAAGCLIFRGTCDNRGRRAALALAALESVVAVGSSNRRGEAADIAISADYVEIGAPGGQRASDDPKDKIWSTGGNRDYIHFQGGCMASGFAGSVGALVMSRFPELSNEQVRQIMRNTARGDQWNHLLGYGVLDAARAVSLKPAQLCQHLRVKRGSGVLTRKARKHLLKVTIENRGAFDVKEALAIVYQGDPRRPAAPQGTMLNPVLLVNKQIGHTVAPVRGLHQANFEIGLIETPQKEVWIQVCTLDRGGSREVDTVRLTLNN